MSAPSRPAVEAPRRRVPWAIFPKVVCVALLLGAFTCVAVLILTTPRPDLEAWRPLVETVGTLFKLVIVPTSFLTVVFSLVLFWPRRRWFLRQRWAQVKLVLLVLTLPALHLAAREVFGRIRAELALENAPPEGPTYLLSLFTFLVFATIAVLLTALYLARYQPRFGVR